MNYTIKQWLITWFNTYAKQHLAEKTQECHQDSIRRAFKHDENLSDMKLDKLTEMYFQSFLDSMSEIYSKSTISHIRSVFNMAYSAAKRNHLITANPIIGTQLPRNASVKKVSALTKFEQEKLEEALQFERHADVVRFYLYTGLRKSELTNLRWRDWDDKSGLIHITKSKTKTGIRYVPLVPEATLILHHLKNNRRSKKGDDFIFLDTKGNQFSKNSLRRMCERLKKAANLQTLTIHMFRHTFATRLAEKGINIKALATILGHKNVAFTMQRYVTPDVDFLKEQIMILSSVYANEPITQIKLNGF